MKWYVEEMTVMGKWSGSIYYCKEPPTEKTVDRKRKFRFPPKLIAPEDMHLTLSEIRKIYSPKEGNTQDAE